MIRSGWQAAVLAVLLIAGGGAKAADPIKIGFASEQTGNGTIAGKQWALAAKIWADDVNAQGGLLGRPVALDYYDDQTNPGLVPGIYSKLIDIDHVDLVVTQGTNMAAPALPTIIEHRMVAIVGFSLALNERFHYDRFFQTMPYGPDGKDAMTRGFFETAMTLDPKPKTVALFGADTDFGQTALDGARGQAKRLGLATLYDRTYPSTNVDFSPIVRSVKAAGADIIFGASYTVDTVGIMRAVAEIGLSARMFGGAMTGPQNGAIKGQLGERFNGFVTYDLYVPEPTMEFPGIRAFLTKYQALTAGVGADPLGFYYPPFAYASFQILGQAVTDIGSLDQDKLARHLHEAVFHTIVGDVKFGPDGEWAKPRILTVQYQNVHGNDLEQFKQPGVQVILYPSEYATGKLIAPYKH
jgi:branched-chain amino acid transport system substrate-binding protein